MPLRPAQAADALAVTRIFQSARAHSLPYLPILHDDAADHAYFAGVVERQEVTLSEADGVPVAFLALAGDQIEHLYVHPEHQRIGHGARLLEHVQARRDQLELWVFQRNRDAIAFYAAHGFEVVESTDGAGNEEQEPDHRMAWSRR